MYKVERVYMEHQTRRSSMKWSFLIMIHQNWLPFCKVEFKSLPLIRYTRKSSHWLWISGTLKDTSHVSLLIITMGTVMLVQRLVMFLKSILIRLSIKESVQLKNCSVRVSTVSESFPMEILLLDLEKESLAESPFKPCNYQPKTKLWAPSLQSLLLEILLISFVEHHNQTFIGSTRQHWLHNWETHVTTKELMILLSLKIFLKFSPQLQSMKSESGMQKTDNNFLEFKFQDLNVTVYSLCMMENQSYQVGVMEKLELSYLNLENCFLSLMMLIITDVQQSQLLQMEPE